MALAGAALIAASAWFALRSPPPDSSLPARPETAPPFEAGLVVDPSVADSAPHPAEPAASTAAPTPTTSADDAQRRALMRSGIETEFRRIYEDVGRDVRLDAAEAEALISLLVDQRMHMEESEFELTVAGTTARKELEAQFRGEIEEQIGAARAALLTNYERSLHARRDVEVLRVLLESHGLPLTERQRTTLIRRAIEQAAYVDPLEFTGAESRLALLQELAAKTEQSNLRMMEVARGVLDSNQFERYESWVEIFRRVDDIEMRSEAAPPRPQ